MRRNEEDIQEMFDQSFPCPSQEQTEATCEGVLQRLNSEPHPVSAALPAQSDFLRPSRPWRRLAAIAAAAAFAVLAFLSFPLIRATLLPEKPVATAVDGSLYRLAGGESRTVQAGERVDAGEILHSNGAGSVIVLADGSHVEMRAQSELSLQRAEEGVRILLNRGGVIVNAAKQGAGHLYVQTKDVTVSVVGTVFLVNAEEAGSRVAVIEGVVRVQQGASSKSLLRGEQVATNPLMESRAVSEEISWSRQVEEYLALLQVAAAGTVPPVEFEVTAIRPQPPEGTISTPLGLAVLPFPAFACQGVDGLIGSGSASVTVPKGRCAGHLLFSSLVAFAYDIGPSKVFGGPEWVRRTPMFHVEAKAADVANVTAAQLRQMLQTMLADRFKLKFHRETRELPEYVLLAGKNGPKLKSASGPEEWPQLLVSVGGELVIKGKSPLRNLADFLLPFVGEGRRDTPVVDKTGLSGTYEYNLSLKVPASTGARGGGGAFDISGALEDQLGLRLELQRVQAETIVIDEADKPSEN